MFGTFTPDVLNLFGLPPEEEEARTPPPPVPPQMTQGVGQGNPIAPGSEGLPPELGLPPTGPQIRAAGGAPGQPVSPAQLAAASPAAPPPIAGLIEQLGLTPRAAQQSTQTAAQDLGNLFGVQDEQIGSMEQDTSSLLDQRLQAPGLLQPWHRTLLTSTRGDIVDQKLTERFGTGKKGAAKQFLYDILAGFAYGDTSRGILSRQVNEERKFAVEIAKRDEALAAQQNQLLKAKLSDDLARDRAAMANKLKLAGGLMTEAQKQRIEAGRLAVDQKKLEYMERGLDIKEADSRARQDFVRAQVDNLTRYRGSRDPGWIHASDRAAEDTIQKFGFDPVTGGKDIDLELYKQAKQYYHDREILHAAEWAKETTRRFQRPQRIKLTDIFAADEKGQIQAVDTFLVVNPDGTSKVESVPLGEGTVTKDMLTKLPKPQQEEVYAANQAARENSGAFETIAQAYVDKVKKVNPGGRFDKADLSGLPFGMLNDNRIFTWGYLNGMFKEDEWLSSGLLAKAQNEFRRVRGTYAISGKQVSDAEREDLRAIMGPLFANPQTLAKMSLMNHYVNQSTALSFTNNPVKAALESGALGRVELIKTAYEMTMERLERGNATPVSLTEALRAMMKTEYWQKRLKKGAGE